MKKIILSLAVIGVVAVAAVGATRAFFSDTQTSTGNTFSAGTVDIAIGDVNAPTWAGNYSIGDLKPGETGNITFDVRNVGTNPVNVSKNLSNFVNTGGVEEFPCPALVENGSGKTSSQPECVAETALDGRVDTVQTQIIYDLSVKVYANETDQTPLWWQEIYNANQKLSLTDVYGTDGIKYVDLGMIPVGGHMVVTQSYHFNPLAENEYQGDTLSFDINIKADQLTSDNGYAQVVLDNKTAAPDFAIIDDGSKATLSYKTINPTFDFAVSGTVVLPSTDYTLVVGTNPWTSPLTACAAGNATSDGSGVINFSGSHTCGTMSSAKAWLIPTTDLATWTGSAGNWNQANYLLETGLVNYTQNP